MINIDNIMRPLAFATMLAAACLSPIVGWASRPSRPNARIGCHAHSPGWACRSRSDSLPFREGVGVGSDSGDANFHAQSTVAFDHLTCEYLVDPLGIDVIHPRLSWQEQSTDDGYTQSAYRIIVSSTPRLAVRGIGDLWDSGKIPGPQSTLIDYAGVPLRSRMRCWWTVQVWDDRGRRSPWSPLQTFSMGLLSPSDWRGQWIGKTLTAPFDIDPLRSAHWIWSPAVPHPDVSAPLGSCYFRLAVHVPAGRPVRRAVFVGTADNAFTLYVDGRAASKGDDWHTLQPIDLTSVLRPGKHELAVEACNVGDAPNPAGFIGVLTIDYQDGNRQVIPTGPAWKTSTSLDPDWQSTAFDDSDWQRAEDIGAFGIPPWGLDTRLADSIAHPPLPARYLRREFLARRKITSAVAYVCGLGFFQLFVNGSPATDHVMDPALSNYTGADYYVTIDVTRLIRAGRNALGVVLGNGRFYAPRLPGTSNYGTPRLLMQLEITYADGTRQTISTDGRWEVTDDGPIRANNEYDGEVYDARLAMPGWDLPGFRTSNVWRAVDVMSSPGGQICAQMIEPIRVNALVRPVSIDYPKPGVAIVDMGHTFYGAVRLRARAPGGTTVSITSAYALLPDGTLKTADNRSAKSTDIYTFAGLPTLAQRNRPGSPRIGGGGGHSGEETWNPVFKGQGYRRVQVTGFPGKLTTANFEGLDEYTSVRPVGEFSCSNDLVNKIHQAMRSGMTMFLRSAPLDPDRDERQAWEGDPAKDSESEAYNFDVAAFYTKWMDDVRRSQHPDGVLPDVAMYWDWSGCVEWPSVFTIIPDWYIGFYADTRLEHNNYAAQKRWVLAMRQRYGRPDGTLEGTGYADWCDTSSIDGKAPDFGSTPRDLVATAYQYHNVRIMQQAAERFHLMADAALWRRMGDDLDAAFMHRFYDPSTHTFTSGTQCSYVLPLAFGLLPARATDRRSIVDNLAHDILVTHDGHLTVGLIGNQWLLQVLTQYGRPDVAWTLVTQTTRPSWGYMIRRGSTSIWERWDYDTRDPGMNSEALLIQAGNVDAWFYQTLGGINYDPAHPGFAHVLVRPHVLGNLTWVKCRFDSPHGLIVSNWTRSGKLVTMTVDIPANTSATITTPDGVDHERNSGQWVFTTRLASATWPQS